MSCLACHLGRLTVRVSFLSSSRARGRQDRTARLGRPRGARRSTGKTERRDVAWPEPLDVRGRAGRQDRTARRKFQERSVGVLPCRLVLPRTLPARSGPDLENCPCSRAGCSSSALGSRRRPSLGLLSCSSSALGSRRRPSLGVLSCLVVRFGGAGGLKPRSLTQKATWEFPSCLLEIPQGPLVADVAASAWAWSCRDCPVLPTLLVKPGSYLRSALRRYASYSTL